MSRIYIETTVPSFYHEIRQEAIMVARRQWTREWFDVASKRHELVTSAAVIDELERGNFASRDAAVLMIERLTPLPLTTAIIDIVHEYIARKLMPADPLGDALHLAFASFYCCDFLATWNCKHLANPNKFDSIARVNGILRIAVPKLVTPLELLGADENE